MASQFDSDLIKLTEDFHLLLFYLSLRTSGFVYDPSFLLPSIDDISTSREHMLQRGYTEKS